MVLGSRSERAGGCAPPRFRLLFALALLALPLCQPPASATEVWELVAQCELEPDVDTPHPAEKVLAIEVRESVRVVACELWHGHSRNLWIWLEPGSAESRDLDVDVPKRAKIKVTFEVARGDETLRVGRRKLKWKKWLKRGGIGWVDGSGRGTHEYGIGPKSFKSTDALPVDLEAGDTLLFTFRFTGMPDLLGIEETEEGIRFDRFFLYVNCMSCGSNDTPCPPPFPW